MKHTYTVTENNNVLVDGKQTIYTNEKLDFFDRERQAYDIIDYILENENENLKEYLNTEEAR